MNKFTPYKKLSKSEQRAANASRRRNWGSLNPVTRRPANPKAYNRHRQKQLTHKEGVC